jgi:hypothetical protein
VLISSADVLLQNQIPNVELSLYHTLIVALLQGFLIFLHIDECRVVPLFYQNGIQLSGFCLEF